MPAGQVVQTLETVAGGGVEEYVPTGQGMHAAELVAPLAVAYVPKGHHVWVEVPADGQYAPA